MMRWQLKPRFRGKKGGVTVAVPGREAGQPDTARVSETLYDGRVIEGDHWARFAGRGQMLMAVQGEAQPIAPAPAPAVIRQDEQIGVQPATGLATADVGAAEDSAGKDVADLDESEVDDVDDDASAPMVHDDDAPEGDAGEPDDSPTVVTPSGDVTPPAASESAGRAPVQKRRNRRTN